MICIEGISHSNKGTISLKDHIAIEGPIERIYLWGMMGVGKSTLAKKLAAELDWNWIDMDQVVVETTGKSIVETFEQEGEAAFRAYETKALKGTADVKHAVISVGGGTPAQQVNAEYMLASGLCVWLDAPVGMLVNRIANAKTERPLLVGLTEEEIAKKIEALMAQRQPFFARAHMILSMNNQSAKEAVQTLARIIRGIS